MRIIAGKLKGRRLATRPHEGLRPTTDRVREAIFSALHGSIDFEETTVIDLFSGTGALGFEALSRGAAEVIFVERDRVLAKQIEAHLVEFDVAGSARVVQGDVFEKLAVLREQLQAQTGRSRLVLADPPYTAHPGPQLMLDLIQEQVLIAGSTFVVGAPKQLSLAGGEAFADGLCLSPQSQKSKTYGDTVIYYFYF